MNVVFHYVEKLRTSSIVLKSEGCLPLCWKVEVKKNKVVFHIAEISILKKINDVVFYLKMEWTKNMEDYLKNFENGRRPQKFWKWKTTSKDLTMEDDLFFEKEDNLKSKGTIKNEK